jgi:hypothetical protein
MRTYTISLFGFVFNSDGCTHFHFDRFFKGCVLHDLEYNLGGSERIRAEVDKRLYKHGIVLDPTPTGRILAGIMYRGVRKYGGNAAHWGFSNIIRYPDNWTGPILKCNEAYCIVKPPIDPDWRQTLPWLARNFDIRQLNM